MKQAAIAGREAGGRPGRTAPGDDCDLNAGRDRVAKGKLLLDAAEANAQPIAINREIGEI